MVFNGITIASLVYEFKSTLGGRRISKITRPERDELFIVTKNNRENYRFQISANTNPPLIYLTAGSKPSSMTAPDFYMLLRKHVDSARIVTVSQPGLGCIIQFELEHLDEMGDLCRKKLIVEIMGKYSNIVFCKEDQIVIDSIKHMSAQVNSIREVPPERAYFVPQTVTKEGPLTISAQDLARAIGTAPMAVQKALHNRLTDISPTMAEEVCHLASIDSNQSTNELTETEMIHLHHAFNLVMEGVRDGRFSPTIIYDADGPVEYGAFPLTCYEGAQYRMETIPSVSSLSKNCYSSRDMVARIHQKSSGLRRIVQAALERNYKKCDPQLKRLKDTERKEKYRVYGELFSTCGYKFMGGETSLRCLDYYTNEKITILLDLQLSAKGNAKKHFDKYNKLKRTYEVLADLALETKAEIDHPESISSSLGIARRKDDLVQVEEELTEYGHARKRRLNDEKSKVTSRPFHYLSLDGCHIYAGENNYQNEELTFRLATRNDWWFHTKGIPGSHVIVRPGEKSELPDRVSEEAGSLVTYYSKGRDNDKVEIDYIQKRNIKRVAGSAPGFVIHHIDYSAVAGPGYGLKKIGP